MLDRLPLTGKVMIPITMTAVSGGNLALCGAWAVEP